MASEVLEVTESNGFVCKETEDGVCVLKAYGRLPVVSVPDAIGGLPVRSIGEYCFWEDARQKNTREDRFFEARGMARICGNFLEEINVADSVTKIEKLAFYNCRNLRELEIGTRLREVGSDVFMNCMRLHLIRLRGGVDEKSGIQKILSQIVADVEVVFLNGGQTEAKVLYPEYYESYDEIAPAHIFGRNIVGEGFRARQCFKEGSADLASYDIIFHKACAGETEETLARIAMNRLRYPWALSVEKRREYEGYVREHAAGIGNALIRQRELSKLSFLAEQKLISGREMDGLIRLASAGGWGEGAAALLRLKHKDAEETARRRYSLE